MPTSLHVNIPEPCQENWQQMTPQEQGRFCGSCQKTVVDFSVMTDKEVLEYFSKANQHVCGRFSNDQLDRELKVVEKKKRLSWVYVWNVLLASLLMTKTYAQGKPVKKLPVKTEVWDQRTMGIVATPEPKQREEAVMPVTLKGKVIDAQTKQPIAGASIMVKDADRGAMADTLGNFELTVARKKAFTLEISAVGYTTHLQMVDFSTNWQNVQVQLQPVYSSLQEATVIGYGTTKGRVMVGGVTSCYKVTRTEKIKRNINDWTPTGLKKDVKIYPNPVVRGNAVQVKLVLPQTGSYKLELLNTAGQVMLIQPLLMQTKEQLIDLYTQTSWSAGVYWIRISSPDTKKVYNSKLLLQ
jgi:hypothetical protein